VSLPLLQTHPTKIMFTLQKTHRKLSLHVCNVSITCLHVYTYVQMFIIKWFFSLFDKNCLIYFENRLKNTVGENTGMRKGVFFNC
jgi:hypothetical protein